MQAGLGHHAQEDVNTVITVVMQLIKHGALVLNEHRRKVRLLPCVDSGRCKFWHLL
jgi:hypothetical protein